MSITVNRLAYVHANREPLFRNIEFKMGNGEKAALTGRNGIGKSILLQIIAGLRTPATGQAVCPSVPFYVPQQTDRYNNLTVSEILGVRDKLGAYRALLKGETSEPVYTLLNGEWDIEDRIYRALALWELSYAEPDRRMHTLSEGEKIKVFLAGIELNRPPIILLDEPMNHLDGSAREKIYDLIGHTQATLLAVSHDRTLLNLFPCIFELGHQGIERFGGNYEFYKSTKECQTDALYTRLNSKEKELHDLQKAAREAAEKQQRRAMRGEKSNLKKRIPRIAARTLKDKTEKSTARLKEIHSAKIDTLKKTVSGLRCRLSDDHSLKINLGFSGLHTGKILISARNINFRYGKAPLWNESLTFTLKSGERIAIEGKNGSGKTTLLKLIAGKLEPSCGELQRMTDRFLYLGQTYSFIHDDRSVCEHTEIFNKRRLPKHTLKTLLVRFLFPQSDWNKKGKELSGGEKMRLALCCLMIENTTPDLFILDEPTNNLDLRNMKILTSVINRYEGTLLVVSHDRYFLKEAGIGRYMAL